MLDLNLRTLVGIVTGLLVLIYMLLILTYCLVLKAVKHVISANCGDVENCVESGKSTQEKIGTKPITDESCTFQYCEECSIYADSGTLPPCFCDTNKGL